MATFVKNWEFNEVKYFVLGYYYPKTWDHLCPLNESEIIYNDLLSQFKQGFNQEYFLEKLTVGITENFTAQELSSLILCTVPSSNQIRHKRRYEEFCKQLCYRTGLINGYNFISIEGNNKPYHLGGKGFTPEQVIFKYDFNLKSIILLEDIIKTGDTLFWVINEFKKKGVKKIYAIILGRSIQKQ